MTPEQFVYWLQGYMEIEEPEMLDVNDIKKIRDHLDQVFKKVTLDYTLKIPTEQFPVICGTGKNPDNFIF